MTFASLDDLALRLPGDATTGAELTAKQQAQGQMLLEVATGLILDAVDRDDAWADALVSVHPTLRGVCLEAVARVMQNPSGARSESEQLGQHQYSVSYTDQAHGLELSDTDKMSCRRAVWGRLSGTSVPATTLDHVIELRETGEITL